MVNKYVYNSVFGWGHVGGIGGILESFELFTLSLYTVNLMRQKCNGSSLCSTVFDIKKIQFYSTILELFMLHAQRVQESINGR